MKYVLVVALLCAAGNVSLAQKAPFKFGEISLEDLKMTRYEKDTSAAAVILGDYGISTFLYTQSIGRFSLTFQRTQQIKILKKEGYAHADFEKNDARKTDIVRNLGFIDTDTIRYHIPDEIYPEVLPKPVKISSRFGEYESGYTLDQGLVVYTRRLKIKKGRYPANTYSEFTDFYKSINRADNAKLVFLNKT